MNRSDTLIPAVVKTALDVPPLWGRLTRLSPAEAELLSSFEIQRGRVVTLSFDLRGGFSDVRARVRSVERDGDGYFLYSLVFLDPAQSELLRKALS